MHRASSPIASSAFYSPGGGRLGPKNSSADMLNCPDVTAYIGPGPGLAVQGPALLLLLGWLLALAVLLTSPLRLLFRRRKKRRKGPVKRLAVLGLDGLEPTRVERLMKEGRLPNLTELARSGSYHRVQTTCPPLSPVAWATFSTGVNPGRHGIFDFVKREAKYTPSLSFSTVEECPTRWGPFRLPRKKAIPRFLRKGKSFWAVLGEHGVLSHVLRVPVSWPPEEFDGLLLSAMGAPDLLGTQGTYTLFTLEKRDPLTHGKLVYLEKDGEQLTGRVEGPRGKYVGLGYCNGVLSVQKRVLTLCREKYTPWIELRFGSISGLVKFLKIDDSSFYMTAVQVSPDRPSTALSHPRAFSVALARILGGFATCGLAEDLGARDDRTLSLEAFLTQSYEIHEERERQFFHSLDRTREGLCLAVFDGPDRIQHMTCDDEHLDELYERMDRLVGRSQKALGKDGDALIVLSDHGFKPLLKLVDLNAWLKAEGYLSLNQDDEIDWTRTTAYTLGLAGISLNLKGREDQGRVEPTERAALCSEIAEKLSQLRDGEERAIHTVHITHDCYQGPYSEGAPDLVVGYYPGFGVNKEAARGRVTSKVIVENDRPWVADHCFEPETVPGVLFSSIPFKENPSLMDLAPTILDLFGVPAQSFHEGRSLLS